MDKWFFQRYEPEFENGAVSLVASNDEKMPKIDKPAPLTSYQKDGKFIATITLGYPYIVKLFEQKLAGLNPSQQAERDAAAKNLFARLDAAFKATIVEQLKLKIS